MNQLADKNVLTMSSREIATLTGKQHFHVKRDIERMISDLKEDPSNFGCTYLDGQNRTQTEYMLDREHTDCLLTGYSAELRMKVIKRWRALEKAVQTGVPVEAIPDNSGKIKGELAIMECFTRLLNPSQSSQIMMLGKIAENNGLNAGFLPAYAVDASPDSSGGSSMVTKPLTALLKQYCIDVPAAAFNWKLRDHGFIRQQSRVNSKNQTVHFWSITDKGLRYGKNLTSPRQPRETQPHWYEETFADLLKIVVQQGEK